MNTEVLCEVERLEKDLLWPGGKRLAIIFNIAFEMWTPGSSSSVNPMGNVLSDDINDPNADSYGRYNVNRGCKRLFDIAESHKIATSVFTSGLVAENHANELKNKSDFGHEIIGHSYGQNLLFPYLNDQEREDNITRSTQLIESATGERPHGWISPRITSDLDVQRKLSQHGYKWHGDALDDDLPYLQKFADSEIMAIPVTIDFNDLPHAMRFGRTPEQFVQMFNTTLDKLLASSRETLILDVIVHGHCYGRPAGAWAFEEIVKRCTQEKDLWLTTRGQIYNYVRPFFGA
ncbi:polysaccharide deacetylase family protein [Marinobacter sp. ATCH36]|uniref:polysaccharide deacetylase family protein n=1 Tax=Marinobacter sp. ATCH36 TaxID=2945106 RepID=UPI002021E7E3|nr:polysaccharide deacetylase family protein [Marinobacter sp. ATCH36]MCL7945434.1 polysaccharide deacetylase family protein [Marinobacter sp. ATCH36]